MNKLMCAVCTLLVALTGCARIQLPGLSLGSSSGGPKTPSVGALTGTGAEGQTTELYKSLTWKNVSSLDADQLFSAAGIKTTFNPHNTMSNLDAEWIPGWDGLQLTDETKTAIAQAAINRTWTAQVHQDFEAFRAEWGKLDARFRPELAAATKGSYYERATALAGLYKKLTEAATAAKVAQLPGGAPMTTGLPNDIVRAMVQLHKDTRREFLARDYFARNGVPFDAFATSGRAPATLEIERDLYVALARKHGSANAAALPVMSEYGSAFKAVKWPTSRQRDQETAQARDAAIAAQKQTFSLTAPGRIASLIKGELPDAPEPKLYQVASSEWSAAGDSEKPFVVKSIKASGDGATVAAQSVSVKQLPYDCRSTGVVDHVDGAGNVFYQKVCKYQRLEITRDVEVDFKELPKGLALKSGDEVRFFGDLVSRSERTVLQKATDKHVVESLRFDGRHLQGANRDKQPLVAFW